MTEEKTIKKPVRTSGKSKRLQGVVVSDKMDKTVVVSVNRFVKHPKYKKYFKISKNYKAHDESNSFKEGDRVEIEETRPISKDKTFKVVENNK
ncbi:30S ribosomal protein S17 [Candidatus Wolfebacteria bacterium]|nr:MAG: 30S ribosomal protein S17 [Candidatus Wolfebacteria bacterium]